MGSGEWVTGKIALKVGGVPLEMEMTVPAAPVKPQRILPVIQQMTNAFVDVGVAAAEAEGKGVSCKAGCGACCRQPVPVSEVEAYQLAELVEAMPEPRRSEIRNRFAAAVEHFERSNWFERIGKFAYSSKEEESDEVMREFESVSMEYFHAGIPCPFLENESCSVHTDRPTACREYLVTTPAANCSEPSAETVKLVGLQVKPSRTLRALIRTVVTEQLGFVPLILALKISENCPEDFPEKTGPDWMAEFFGKLTGKEIVPKEVKPRKSRSKKPRRKTEGLTTF